MPQADLDHTGREKTGVDANRKPLKVGDRVTLSGKVASMNAEGQTVVDIDSSDGIHNYQCACHCHCCVKAE